MLARSNEGTLTHARVVNVYHALSDGYYVINNRLEVTPTHPFSVDGEWVVADDLRVGDVLTNSDGSNEVIRSKHWVNRGVRVYNIDVDGPDTFFAAGLLVHNKDPHPKNPNGN